MLKSRPVRLLIYILIPLILLFTLYKIFGIADLRTETAKNINNEYPAKQLIIDMGKAHGIKNWDDVKTYQVDFEDEFFGKLGSKSHGYGINKSSMTLNYITDTFDGRIDFNNGPHNGESWGMQCWDTYIKKPDELVSFENHANAKFWVPTYQYFIEFPMRIQNANAFNYAGDRIINGVLCHGVMASSNTTEPQGDVDQYLIWIDKKTKRLIRLEYTVREMFRFLKGAINFKEYKTYYGILLPTIMPVESNLVPSLLHEMRIKNFIPNVLIPEDLRPNQSLPVLGDEKE